MRKLLSLDLSLASSGWAVFDLDTKKLIEYGVIKTPKIKGISKMRYPESAFRKMCAMSDEIGSIYSKVQPQEIVIEEINRGINRIAQKSLDALHFMVLQQLQLHDYKWLREVIYVDSNGATGWRGILCLKFAQIPKTERKGHSRSAVWKKLAELYVNKKYGTKFDVWKIKSHADTADAIALGSAYLLNKKP